MSIDALIVLGWLAGIVPAAFALYPLARRDATLADPHFAATLGAALWPMVLVTLAVLVPFWLLSQALKRWGPQ